MSHLFGGSVAIGQVGSDGLQTVSSVASVASIANVSSVAKTVSTIAGVAQAVTVRAVVGIGLSGGQSQAAGLDNWTYSNIQNIDCTNKVKSEKEIENDGTGEEMRLAHQNCKSEHL